MLGVRTRGFFEALAAVPNILLLSDDVTAHEIIRGSRAVFTLTGTTALEAFLYGVPAVALGQIYFSCFDGIHPVRGPDQLRATVREVLATAPQGDNDRAALAGLAALYESSHPGKISVAYPLDDILEPGNMEQVVQGIISALAAQGVTA